MWKSIAGWVSDQVRSERDKLQAAGGLPFSELLPASYVQRVLDDEHVEWRECVYSPLVTLWTFLSQTLCVDHSCRQAVARLRAFLTADGQQPCSAQTGPYCKARQKLPENVCARLARDAGQALHERVSDCGLLNGRPVKLVDGTTVSMPDTAANQAEYPQSRSQKPGLGFPIARVVALLSLASGAALDLAMGRYTGKNTGETALFRQLWRSLFPGDVVVGDRYFASYWDLALLAICGVDSVYRQHQLRLSKRLRVRRLGSGDWLLRLPKPQRPSWMDHDTYRNIPQELLVREVSFRVRVRGWRVRELTLVTTLCDAEVYSLDELARVYHAALAGRSGLAFDQDHDANGRTALQDARHGAQGNLAAPVGLQPDPHRDGRGRGAREYAAAGGELQRRAANAHRVSRDRGAGSARRLAGALRVIVGGDCHAPGRQPPASLRATRRQTPPQTTRPADHPTPRSKTPFSRMTYKLRKCHSQH